MHRPFKGKGATMFFETLIIGGGIAGMSCARELRARGHDVAIVTEELGGRVCYDPELQSNFGAVFYMENYKNAKKLLDENAAMSVKLSDLMLHSSEDKVFRGNSLTMLRSLPQMAKFLRFMKREFIPEYSAYKSMCETVPVIEAMDRHPQIKKYFMMQASTLIDDLGIGKICDNFISKFAYACTGSRINELNALDFLNVSQGVVMPIYDFKFDADRFKESLNGHVYLDTVSGIEKADAGWKVTTESGALYSCRFLVVATSGLVTQRLLNIEKVRQPTRLVSYLVEGTPRGQIADAPAHYFGDEFDIIAINAREDGRFNVYTREPIDLGKYFQDPEVIYSRDWSEALFTVGRTIQPQDWDENLWIAGDINGLGLEPASISGVYAANRIVASA